MKISRRSMIAGVSTAAFALPFHSLFGRRAHAGTFGPLIPDPAGILDLPSGFRYRILDTRGDPMDDGYRVGGRPDAMGCFTGATPGTFVLLRNHEVGRNDRDNSPLGPDQDPPPEAYDVRGGGSVTRVVLDANTLERISSNVVLGGTYTNCAGGISPWGWLSCEESTSSDHGYVFLCRPDADRIEPPRLVSGYGRFKHEAAAVDPTTRIAYLTEDQGDSCFYRFVPTAPAEPFDGVLQAMRVIDSPQFDTGSGMQVGDSLAIDWVEIADPTPSSDTVRQQAQDQGAAIVRRGEGLWLDEGSAFVCSTSGGPRGAGQIFRLDPAGDTGTLTLIAQSEDTSVLDSPDNITVAPWGDIYMAEDGGGTDYVRILHPDGTISDFARNALSGSEFAGVCFSPDGKALFVNMQADHLTLIINGPFPDNPRPLPPPPEEPPDLPPVDQIGCNASGAEGLGNAALLTAATIGATVLGRRSPSGDPGE